MTMLNPDLTGDLRLLTCAIVGGSLIELFPVVSEHIIGPVLITLVGTVARFVLNRRRYTRQLRELRAENEQLKKRLETYEETFDLLSRDDE
jgi:cell division protein FtsB